MTHLILLRHGRSEWNESGRFTGWTDVDLSESGLEEAKRAGERIRNEGISYDVAYTSVLKRAIRTAWIVSDVMDLMWIPLHISWRLNEKHYGALQGLYKEKTVEEYGADKVHAWRRVYDVRPPPLDPSDNRYPSHDPKYRELSTEELPATESLKDTLQRTMPYWFDEILPRIRKNNDVFVSAHGNSLRSLVKHLDGISDEDIASVNIPTGIPLIYEMKGDKVVESYYLASDAELSKAKDEASRASSFTP
ncbi:MAG: 2,3-diphosphoglycerate-dependent phosphoglycerate mutase [Euryarchaeota archaeon]|nr:2,3-diphosphoglycerate-dependent phosphoglycerate mutase [Euryarchaeota archaeon]